MKRLILSLPLLMVVGLAAFALAGDFHTGANLVCSDCHVAHYSQSHTYTGAGTVFPPLGPGGPHSSLLRDEEVKTCLSCHDGQSWAPDVFGGSATNSRRLAGGLNAKASTIPNDAFYEEIDGHTLYSTSMPPGGASSAYTVGAHGLVCTNCHAQHGFNSYRNLLGRGIFLGDTISWAVGTNDLSKDVYERVARGYTEPDVDFNEPDTRNSKYGRWCQNCHVDFHGQGGDANMGGLPGGQGGPAHPAPWKRHPTADVNIGTPNATFISSLDRFNGRTHRVKVMDSQGLWDGTPTDNTVTPSCMSCHKAHGNKNPFGLIFMIGTGPPTEDGDGGVYKDLCRQCHIQGG